MLSGLIWFQSVCKGYYEQTTLVGNEFIAIVITKDADQIVQML